MSAPDGSSLFSAAEEEALRTTTEYRANGVVMRYVVCRWCRGRSLQAMRACSLCKGSGVEKWRRIA